MLEEKGKEKSWKKVFPQSLGIIGQNVIFENKGTLGKNLKGMGTLNKINSWRTDNITWFFLLPGGGNSQIPKYIIFLSF